MNSLTRNLTFWTLFSVTMAIYSAMVVWSLPTIAAEAGGLTPFDLRPTGYSPEEARAFLSALSVEGAEFYISIQHRLDLLYPMLMAVTLSVSLFALAPNRWGVWRFLLAALPLPSALFDYLENAAIAAMLRAGPGGASDDLINTASQWTVLKSAASTVALSALLIMLGWWFFRRWRLRLDRHGDRGPADPGRVR